MKVKKIKRSIFSIIMIALLLLGAIPIGVSAAEDVITNDENGIPDSALYNYILSISDSNSDGIIQKSEIKNIIEIYYDGYDNGEKISNLIGLNYLYNLKEIRIVNNNISTLDGIQGLNLKKIFVYYNQLVDISAISGMASSLEVLEVSHNKLSKLPDMTNFYKLQYNEWTIGYQTTSFGKNKLTYNELYYNLPSQLVEFESDEYKLIDVWAILQSPDEVPLPVETVLNSESGISISGLIIPGATLQVNQVSVDIENSVVVYDINLIRDHEKIQPSGEITISIPSEYSDCNVFWIKDDGTKVNMNAEYVDGKYVFTTDHLSVYALVINIVPTVPEPTENIPVSTETVPEPTETDPVPTETVPEPTETDPITTESKTTEPTTTIPVTVTTNNGIVSTDNGTIQTGSTSIAVIILLLLSSLTTGLFIYYRRKKIK